MKLFYYDGNNFGDQLNPMIFGSLLPDFFDDNEDEVLVGIGSLLGFNGYKKAKIKYIFSTGIGIGNNKEYGILPIIDDSYNFFCVRGPLTAKLLKLDPKLAVTDGAILIRTFNFPKYEKKFNYSFMPHKNTVYKFDWKPLCSNAGINFINPHDPIDQIIKEILESKIIMAESLHGAIVADAFRIPWIPFKTFYSINRFKWQDWTQSLGLQYLPFEIFPLFEEKRLEQLINRTLKQRHLSSFLASTYDFLQNKFLMSKVIQQLENLKLHSSFLSSDEVISSKTDELLEKINELNAVKKVL